MTRKLALSHSTICHTTVYILMPYSNTQSKHMVKIFLNFWSIFLQKMPIAFNRYKFCTLLSNKKQAKFVFFQNIFANYTKLICGNANCF